MLLWRLNYTCQLLSTQQVFNKCSVIAEVAVESLGSHTAQQRGQEIHNQASCVNLDPGFLTSMMNNNNENSKSNNNFLTEFWIKWLLQSTYHIVNNVCKYYYAAYYAYWLFLPHCLTTV